MKIKINPPREDKTIEEMGLYIIGAKAPITQTFKEAETLVIMSALQKPAARRYFNVGDRFFVEVDGTYTVYEVAYIKPEGATRYVPGITRIVIVGAKE